ncbi:MAG TPA: malate:quinone oxidoreductase [Terrimesophilobacter sp.]|nr:malate:quinone oxidoreductase [Terrimesophilobacter sp.]
MSPAKPVDVALIGGGIMSATLAVILQKLEPSWEIRIFETLHDVALESSNPWNNAGTGHAALCELNYTKEQPDGSVDIAQAVKINEQFHVSRQFWSHLTETGDLPDPSAFINTVPHMSFVWGEENVAFLRRRFDALSKHPLFASMEFSDDPAVIHRWAPSIIRGRSKSEPVAATRSPEGTDVDFGALTHALLATAQSKGAKLHMNQKVTGLRREKDRTWRVRMRRTIGKTPSEVRARFVFVGAGGGALKLLQKSGIPEAKGYGGFPVSGKFYRTDKPELVSQHLAKVYGKASVGAPPMSVPHLDTRVIGGSASLMFGPYAGFTPKFLKRGSWLDLPLSIRFGNIGPMLKTGLDNLGLTWYLITQVLASSRTRFRALRDFMPTANPRDWYPITAGQRVQVIKKDATKGGILQFGTEVVTGGDGTIAGLLGASPGASTAVPIMLDVLQKCFPDRMAGWENRISTMVPSHGAQVGTSKTAVSKALTSTSKVLRLQR